MKCIEITRANGTKVHVVDGSLRLQSMIETAGVATVTDQLTKTQFEVVEAYGSLFEKPSTARCEEPATLIPVAAITESPQNARAGATGRCSA